MVPTFTFCSFARGFVFLVTLAPCFPKCLKYNDIGHVSPYCKYYVAWYSTSANLSHLPIVQVLGNTNQYVPQNLPIYDFSSLQPNNSIYWITLLLPLPHPNVDLSCGTREIIFMELFNHSFEISY